MSSSSSLEVNAGDTHDREAQCPLDGPELSSKDIMIEEQLAMLDPQLTAFVSLAEEQFTDSLYQELVSDDCIDAFLTRCDLYDVETERWLNIPKTEEIADKSELYKPIFEVIDEIMKGLGNGADGTRQIKQTHDVQLLHREQSETDHYSSPPLAIKARGPSFELPTFTKNGSSTSIGFSNVTACFDVERSSSEDAYNGSSLSQLAQQAVYARQIFIQQPNRKFVRSLVITEHCFHFYHFDRAGAQFVSYVNYHSNPDAFIRIILGLSSTDEEVLGLDTSVQWIIEDGRKTGGSVTVIDDKTKVEKTYSMVDTEPCVIRYTLYGRSTVCWIVWDAENEQKLFIKDAWTPSERPDPEHELLEEALGLEGVVQMVACEGNRCETQDFRAAPEHCWQPPNSSKGRRCVRVVEEYFEKDILCFGSEMELLCALRDAIAGHANLYAVDVMHCDISCNNIMLGRPGAKPGYRGLLIDFDGSARIGRITPERSVTGSRRTMSISILNNISNHKRGLLLSRDHLDELEAFLYVFGYIIHSYSAPGKFNPPSFILDWIEARTAQAHYLLKSVYLLHPDPTLDEKIQPFWSDATVELYLEFYTFIRQMAAEKERIRLWRHLTDKEQEEILDGITSNPDSHYDFVLGLFDQAIETLSNCKGEKAV